MGGHGSREGRNGSADSRPDPGHLPCRCECPLVRVGFSILSSDTFTIIFSQGVYCPSLGRCDPDGGLERRGAGRGLVRWSGDLHVAIAIALHAVDTPEPTWRIPPQTSPKLLLQSLRHYDAN